MKRVYSNFWVIFLFLTPALLFYLAFCLFPIFQSFWISLYRWNIMGTKVWVGLENYRRMLGDDVLIDSAKHIFILLLMLIIFTVPLAFLISWLLTQKLKGTNFIRSVMYIPNLLSTVAVGTLWVYLYHGEYGIVNRILAVIGINQSGSMLGNADSVLWAIGFVMAWQSIGFYILLYVVAIQNVPQDIIDSSRVDGVNHWQRVWLIILPLIRPTLDVSLILLTTSAFKSFDYIFVLSRGGPNHASEVMSSYMYTVGFLQMDLGYAASIGLVLFILSLIITRLVTGFRSKDAAQY